MSSVFGTLNSNVVSLTGNQTITGAKTFLKLTQPTIYADASVINSTEISFLEGLSSNAQNQIDGINIVLDGLTALEQALQAIQPAPNATTVEFNNTILLADPVSSNTNTLSNGLITMSDGSNSSTATATTFNLSDNSGDIQLSESLYQAAFQNNTTNSYCQVGTNTQTNGVNGVEANESSGNTISFVLSTNAIPGKPSLAFYDTDQVTGGYTASSIVLDGSANLRHTDITLKDGNNTATLGNTFLTFGNTSIGDAITVSAGNKQIIVTDGTTTMVMNVNGITTRNTVANATHYLNFSDSSSTGTGAVQKTVGISCNPSTNTITATTFSGALSGLASSASSVLTVPDLTTASNCPVGFFVNTSGQQAPHTNTNLSFQPTTNTLRATTFEGALTGLASSATNVVVTSDNTSGTYYIPFAKTSGTGGKPLFIDDVTGPLSYNPSTSTVSASAYTITSTPATASVASTFGQVGLVYLGGVSVFVTGTASAQNLPFAGLFNSTYKNYRINFDLDSQKTYTQYPSYALQAFLGTGVPTIASLYGFEMTSANTSVVAPVYTAGATISSAPLIFAVSSIQNKQIVIEVRNVGFANTATQLVELYCKSVYSNPGATGTSDRTITASSLNGATITGLTIQQSAIGVGNNMTVNATIYGYNLI